MHYYCQSTIYKPPKPSVKLPSLFYHHLSTIFPQTSQNHGTLILYTDGHYCKLFFLNKWLLTFPTHSSSSFLLLSRNPAIDLTDWTSEADVCRMIGHVITKPPFPSEWGLDHVRQFRQQPGEVNHVTSCRPCDPKSRLIAHLPVPYMCLVQAHVQYGLVLGFKDSGLGYYWFLFFYYFKSRSLRFKIWG